LTKFLVKKPKILQYSILAIMSSGFASLHKILKDETRRKIILLLNDKGSLSYTDLMDTLGIVSTGTLNYHLKVLGDLLTRNEAGQYMLTEKGKLASRILLEFPEENIPSRWDHDRDVGQSFLLKLVRHNCGCKTENPENCRSDFAAKSFGNKPEEQASQSKR